MEIFAAFLLKWSLNFKNWFLLFFPIGCFQICSNHAPHILVARWQHPYLTCDSVFRRLLQRNLCESMEKKMWMSLQSMILNATYKIRCENYLENGVSQIWTKFGLVFIANSDRHQLQIFPLNNANIPVQDSAIESLNLQFEIVDLCFPPWCINTFWVVTQDGLLQSYTKLGDTWTWKSSFHLLMGKSKEDTVSFVITHETHRAVYVVSESKTSRKIQKVEVLVTGPSDVSVGRWTDILEDCPKFSLVSSDVSLYGWTDGLPNIFFSWSSTGTTVKSTDGSEMVCSSNNFRQICLESMVLWAQNPSKSIKRIFIHCNLIVVVDAERTATVRRESDGKVLRNFQIGPNCIRDTAFQFGQLLALCENDTESFVKFYNITEEDKVTVVSVPMSRSPWRMSISEDPLKTLYIYNENNVVAALRTVSRDKPLLEVLTGFEEMYNEGELRKGHVEMDPPVCECATVKLALADKFHDKMSAEGKSYSYSDEMKGFLKSVLSQRAGNYVRRPVVEICEKYAALVDAMDEMRIECKFPT